MLSCAAPRPTPRRMTVMRGMEAGFAIAHTPCTRRDDRFNWPDPGLPARVVPAYVFRFRRLAPSG